jgi:hypothetical protein
MAVGVLSAPASYVAVMDTSLPNAIAASSEVFSALATMAGTRATMRVRPLWLIGLRLRASKAKRSLTPSTLHGTWTLAPRII